MPQYDENNGDYIMWIYVVLSSPIIEKSGTIIDFSVQNNPNFHIKSKIYICRQRLFCNELL